MAGSRSASFPHTRHTSPALLTEKACGGPPTRRRGVHAKTRSTAIGIANRVFDYLHRRAVRCGAGWRAFRGCRVAANARLFTSSPFGLLRSGKEIVRDGVVELGWFAIQEIEAEWERIWVSTSQAASI